MKEYVWVIIAVIAILLFVLTCIGIGTFLWRMFRYRPRRVIRVSPTTAKPIQPVQSVESQYSNYANYLNNNDSMYNASKQSFFFRHFISCSISLSSGTFSSDTVELPTKSSFPRPVPM